MDISRKVGPRLSRAGAKPVLGNGEWSLRRTCTSDLRTRRVLQEWGHGEVGTTQWFLSSLAQAHTFTIFITSILFSPMTSALRLPSCVVPKFAILASRLSIKIESV